MSIAIMPLVAYRVAVSVAADAVSAIFAASSQAQEHCQNQRRDRDHGYLQMSHIKLLA